MVECKVTVLEKSINVRMNWKLGQRKDYSARLEEKDRFPNTSVLKIDILSNGATWPSQNGAYFGDEQY